MDVVQAAELFRRQGGEFLVAPEVLAGKLDLVRGYVFDWDGVFNSGTKHEERGSPFAEPDAMGTNLLRFGHWLATGELPVVAVITGENNPSAQRLAQREHFDALYSRAKHKAGALQHLCDASGLRPDQVAFVFDDVLDLPLARVAGVRFMVRRPGSPLLLHHVRASASADYLTGCTGDTHAVREVCELVLGLRGLYGRALEERVAWSGPYRRYLTLRDAGTTRAWAWDGAGFSSLPTLA